MFTVANSCDPISILFCSLASITLVPASWFSILVPNVPRVIFFSVLPSIAPYVILSSPTYITLSLLPEYGDVSFVLSVTVIDCDVLLIPEANVVLKSVAILVYSTEPFNPKNILNDTLEFAPAEPDCTLNCTPSKACSITCSGGLSGPVYPLKNVLLSNPAYVIESLTSSLSNVVFAR